MKKNSVKQHPKINNRIFKKATPDDIITLITDIQNKTKNDYQLMKIQGRDGDGCYVINNQTRDYHLLHSTQNPFIIRKLLEKII